MVRVVICVAISGKMHRDARALTQLQPVPGAADRWQTASSTAFLPTCNSTAPACAGRAASIHMDVSQLTALRMLARTAQVSTVQGPPAVHSASVLRVIGGSAAAASPALHLPCAYMHKSGCQSMVGCSRTAILGATQRVALCLNSKQMALDRLPMGPLVVPRTAAQLQPVSLLAVPSATCMRRESDGSTATRATQFVSCAAFYCIAIG